MTDIYYVLHRITLARLNLEEIYKEERASKRYKIAALKFTNQLLDKNALWAKYIFLHLFETRTPVPERFMAFPWPQINSKCLYLGLETQIDGNSLIWQ